MWWNVATYSTLRLGGRAWLCWTGAADITLRLGGHDWLLCIVAVYTRLRLGGPDWLLCTIAADTALRLGGQKVASMKFLIWLWRHSWFQGADRSTWFCSGCHMLGKDACGFFISGLAMALVSH